jgi:RHS repeat-associated protein
LADLVQLNFPGGSQMNFMRVIFVCFLIGLSYIGSTFPALADYKINVWRVYSFGYAEDAADACKLASTGPAPLGYNGSQFSHVDPVSEYQGYCVDNTADTYPVDFVCFTFADNGNKIGESPGYCREPLCLPCLFGNPTDLPTQVKVETAIDWQSPLDSRFRFARGYRSDPSQLEASRLYGDWWALDHNFYRGHQAFGGVWRDEFNDLVASSNPAPEYRKWDGLRVAFDAPGPTTTRSFSRGGNTYSIVEVNAFGGVRWLVEDGTGKKMYMNATSSPGYFIWFLRSVQEIVWPDGYMITVTRDQTTGRIQYVQDNRGQRAEYTWSNNAVANSSVYLLTEINIDTAYNGSTFAPDVRLNYSFEQNLIYPDRPKLVEVSRTDIALTDTKVIFGYAYKPNTYTPVPLIETVYDGRTDVSNNLKPWTSVTYEPDSWLAASSSHPGGVDSYNFSSTVNFSNGTRTLTVTNPLGQVSTYTATPQDSLVRLTGVSIPASTGVSPASSSVGMTPNPGGAPGFVYSRTEKNGSLTTFTRDNFGRVLTKTEDASGADPRVTTYTWPTTSLRLPLTRTTEDLRETFTYTTEGLLLTYTQEDIKSGSPTNGQTRTWTYTYTTQASGLKVLTQIDGPGLVSDGITDVSTFTYATDGTLNTATDPLGLVTTVQAKNAAGQPTQVLAPDGVVWTFTYDIVGRLLTSTMTAPAATAKTSTYTYDVIGQLLTYTNTRNKTWTFTYDDARRLTKVTNPSGDVANYAYDLMGNTTHVGYTTGANPESFYEDTQFDQLGRLLKTLGANGQVWDYTHDVEDNLTVVEDPLNYTDTNSYDALNRVIQTVDRENYTTGFEHNDADQLTEFTDPRSLTTSFTYNGFGDVITEVSPDKGTTTYTYDRRALVKTVTDARGITVTYSYDNAGNVTLIDYPSGATNPDTTFTYGTTQGSANAGKLTGTAQGPLTAAYAYSYPTTGGSKVIATLNYPASRSYTVTTQQDNEGNVTLLTYPSGDKVEYTYDNDNRVTQVRWQKTGTSTWVTLASAITYVPNGPMKTLTFGDGYKETRTYDTSYRLIGMTDTKASNPTLMNYTYGYTTRDDLASITDNLVATGNETFTYTPRQMLAAATGSYAALSWNYDGVGNRLSETSGAITDIYSYGTGDNRLTGVTRASAPIRAFTHDAAGNTTSDTKGAQVYGYTYDAAGRMSAFSLNGVVQSEYRYNAFGQQAVRKQTAGATIHSVFGPDGNRIAEYDEATGTLLRQYVWIGLRPVAVLEGTARTRFFTRVDYIGRPIYATNTSGVKQWTAKYLPFGGVQTTTGSPITLRFPGQWFQAETGLYQNWMRDYDPTTGRYIQADPLGLVDGASVYGYALQSPGLYFDPRGEDATFNGGWANSSSASAGAAGESALARIVGFCFSKLALPLAIIWPTQMGDGSLQACQECDWTFVEAAEHTKNATPSNLPKHQDGEARKKQDAGNEKGDEARRLPRKRPDHHKGPWPPKKPAPFQPE